MAASSQKRISIKIYVSLGLAIVIIACLGLIWSFSIFGRAPGRLEAELTAAHGDGMPISTDELRSQTQVDENQNAAPFLRLAISQFKSWELTEAGKTYSKRVGSNLKSSELTPSQIDELEPALQQLAPTFDLLRQAAAKPKLDFHREWEKGPGILLPELADERGCSTAAIIQAKYEFNRGNVSAALEMVDLSAKLSRLCGQEPLIIGLLVQVAMSNQVIQTLGEFVKKKANDVAFLEKSKGILNDLGPQPDVLPALRSEFVTGRIAIKMMATGRPEVFGPDGNGNGVMRLARFGPIRTTFDWRFTQFYHQMYKAIAQSGTSVLGIQKAFRDSQNKLDQAGGRDWTYALTNLLSPVFVGMGDAIGEEQARRNLLSSAIDLFQIRTRTGKFPATLPGQSGYWLDPFTEKPLMYKPSRSGFLIYSFARDGKDNEGQVRDKYGGDEPYDLPFTYP